MSNEIVKTTNLNQYLALPDVTNRLNAKLGVKEAVLFKAALSSAVSTNNALMTECDPGTVVNAALIGHALNLPPSPQLGYYYMVPFANKRKNTKDAQFIMGYKGYIQLAMRSGYYKKLNVVAVKAGEFVSYNPLTEELTTSFIEDPEKRELAETVGFCGFFEYINGFTKLIYMTKKQMEVYADKYSPAFSMDAARLIRDGKMPQKDMWKYSSFWYKDFDAMGRKTILRQLLSKWGAMSIEMQQAHQADEPETFAEAQANAQTMIETTTGTEVVDTSFEPHTAPADEAAADDAAANEDFMKDN